MEHPTVAVTRQTVSEILADLKVPDTTRERIEQDYAREFEDAPPVVQTLIDPKLGQNRRSTCTCRRTGTERCAPCVSSFARLLTTVSRLGQEFPLTHRRSSFKCPKPKTCCRTAQQIDGQRCLVIPLDEHESASINGVHTD